MELFWCCLKIKIVEPTRSDFFFATVKIELIDVVCLLIKYIQTAFTMIHIAGIQILKATYKGIQTNQHRIEKKRKKRKRKKRS